MLEVGAVGREACFATTQGAVQIRRRGDNINVILGKRDHIDSELAAADCFYGIIAIFVVRMSFLVAKS
jgi:hypothetical protein